jgi:hypothetical protein
MHEIHLSSGSSALRAFLQLRREIDVGLDSVARGRVIDLNSLAGRLSEVTEEGSSAAALAGALRALDRAQRWEPALAAAEPQPERFRDSARYLAATTAAGPRVDSQSPGLEQGLTILSSLASFDDVVRAAQALRRTALPRPVTTLFDRRRGWTPPEPEVAPKVQPVVYLRFDVDDRAVGWPLAVQSRRAYQITVTARPDAWPVGAERLDVVLKGAPSALLAIDPITIPAGSGHAQTWMVSDVQMDPHDHVDLIPEATFGGPGVSQPAQVVGHRQLRVVSLDPTLLGKGQPFVAQRIVQLLAELDRRIPGLPAEDRRDLVTLLDATAAFESLALERDDLVGIDERTFQQKLKQAFVQDPRIGRDIAEGSRLGGGIVDLILRRINDELKVSHEFVDIADAERLVGQPTQYGAGTDSPVSILTVLDDSRKLAPPGVLGNYMRWVYPELHGVAQPAVPSMVAVVIVKVGFRDPHEWTRTPVAEATGAGTDGSDIATTLRSASSEDEPGARSTGPDNG